jgi:hypothetical protein
LARVIPALLIAQIEHGPQLHGPLLLALLGLALLAGLVALVRRAAARWRSGRERRDAARTPSGRGST